MRRILPLLLLLTSLWACSKTNEQPPADAGAPVDNCNSPALAKANAACALPVNGNVSGYISPAGDIDWYYLNIPSPLPPRALVEVTATYDAPSSPVTLKVNTFKADGLTSIGSAVDQRPRGAPGPASVTSRLSEAGEYYVLVQDDYSDNDDAAHSDFDARHAYKLSAQVISDPDLNEPNDTVAQATPINLTGNQGSIQGVLATTGDVDVYTVNLDPASVAPNRAILYVSIDSPDLEPPGETRLAYHIDRAGVSDGGSLAIGWSDSPIGAQHVSTARVLPGANNQYVITVQGYKRDAVDPDPPGDPRLTYTVNVKLLGDLDVNEPNDTQATAKLFTLGSVGASQTISGRISSVSDQDWFAVNVGGSGQNTRLKFQLTYDDAAPNSKRFPPAGKTLQHQVTVYNTGYTSTSDCTANCKASSQAQGAACAVSGSFSTPSCVNSVRLEDISVGLGNFIGEVPIPAGSSRTYYVLVEDQSDDAADDRGYTLKVDWLSETSDEASAYHDNGAQAVAVTVPVGGSYNQDPGSSGEAAGYLSHGQFFQGTTNYVQPANDPLLPIIVGDYDQFDDADFYKLSWSPSTYTDGGGQALSWATGWTIGSGGTRPYDIVTTYYFCDQTVNASCDPTGKWYAIPIGYRDGVLMGWVGSSQPGWDFNQAAGSFVARANECFCLEPRFAKSGVAFAQVEGISRTSYTDAPYKLHNAFGPYPQNYTNGSGASATCPGVDAGGCRFCSQTGGQTCEQVQGLPEVLRGGL